MKSTFIHFLQTPDHCLRVSPTLSENGLLQKHWKGISNPIVPSTVYILSKRNYNVYDNIVKYEKKNGRFIAVLDTGACSRLICLSELPL